MAQKNNVEFITEMMMHSHFGPLAQVFVMDALGKFAHIVADAPRESFDRMHGFVCPEAWQGVAREIATKIDLHLEPPAMTATGPAGFLEHDAGNELGSGEEDDRQNEHRP